MPYQAEQLRFLLESSADRALIMFDAGRRITLWNGGAERLLGWTQAEALGQSADIFFMAPDREQNTPQDECRLARENGHANAERWHVRKDGTPFWSEARVQTVNSNGQLRGYLKIFRDLSERRQAQDELRQQGLLIDMAFSALITRDRDNRIRQWNRGAEAMYGWTEAEALDQVTHEHLQTTFPTTREALEERLKREGFCQVELGHVHKDGTPLLVESRQSTLTDAGGAHIGYVEVNRDVTAQKRAEAAQQEKSEQLQSIINNCPAFICVRDAEGRYVVSNHFADTIFGLPPGAAIGKTNHDLFPTAFADVLRANDQEVLCANRSREFLETVPTQDGERIFLSIKFPLHDAEGVPVATGVVATDITERQQYEAQIEFLNTRLQAAMAETHHRIKNNLQVITALMEMQTLDSAETIPAKEIERISTHVRSLAVIHDLLTTQAKGDARMSHISARTALTRLLVMLQDVMDKRLVIGKLDDAQLPVQKVASLALLVNELVANGIKHSPGQVLVSFYRIDHKATLEVCDAGAGFAPGFDPRKATSTGMGLIEMTARYDLGGDIRFESRPEGARVVVTFPIVSDEGGSDAS